MPRLRTKKTEFLLRKTIFYCIFSAIFISVGYIAAQARKMRHLICTNIAYLNAVKAIGLQNSKTYLHAGLAHEKNRILLRKNKYSTVFLVLFLLL